MSEQAMSKVYLENDFRTDYGLFKASQSEGFTLIPTSVLNKVGDIPKTAKLLDDSYVAPAPEEPEFENEADEIVSLKRRNAKLEDQLKASGQAKAEPEPVVEAPPEKAVPLGLAELGELSLANLEVAFDREGGISDELLLSLFTQEEAGKSRGSVVTFLERHIVGRNLELPEAPEEMPDDEG